MSKINKKLAILMVPLMLLSGCNDKDYGPDAESLKIQEAVNPVSDFEKGDASHLSQEQAATTTIRIHYHRLDDGNNNRSTYRDWGIWAWDMSNGGNGSWYGFDHYDKYGVYVDIDLSVVSGGKSMSKMGFIVTTQDWSKDPDGDREIAIADTSKGGIQDIYTRSKDVTVFDSESNALKATINCAVMKNFKEITVLFKPINSSNFSSYKKRFSIYINDQKYENYSVGSYDSSTKSTLLTLKDNLNIKDKITVCYKFDDSWTNEVPLLITSYFDTDEFKANYTYTGDDLGATFDNEINPTKTTFKVWAPTSKSVKLNVYSSGNYTTDVTPENTYEMTLGQKGVFEYTVNQNLDGKYYTYTVENTKGINEVVDPYAKSAGVNGRRGMVVNFTKLNGEVAGWSSDSRPNFGSNNVDGSIYEMHVRDMTINPNSGVSAANRGKFLGLTETGTTYSEGGTTVKTGLDHIKELGVSHVQIQPFYDYSSVDESLANPDLSKTNYNWGYDPLNYNVLEGSYSTNAADGYNRIKEFKQMVMAMHESGLSINMDVVYNHTSSSENSNFNTLVPYYYYRTQSNGSFYNGSGCGNEMASDRYMVNKFIRESCKFWIDEYHLSGFRFDLMGLLDNQTMIDVYNDCKSLYSNIMIYGEPWTGGSSKLKSGTSSSKLTSQQTVQSSLAQSYFSGSNVLVGAFSDGIRNAIRGENSPDAGFVQGRKANGLKISQCVKGIFNEGDNLAKSINPNQVLNYVSCHDNYTLMDQLLQTTNKSNILDQYTQADSIVFLAQGIPFIQEGEEFCRSKYNDNKYQGNSYNTGDFDNDMDYSLKIAKADVYSKIKELIKVRNDNSSFRLGSRGEINSRMKNVTYNAGVISYEIDNLLVIHTIDATTVSLNGNYNVIYSNVRASYDSSISSISLSANESVVLKKVA